MGRGFRAALIALTAGLMLLVSAARTAEHVPVVTIIADFEDDSVAATIASVQNALRTACALKQANIPARGQHCLQLDIGVTGGEASAVVDFRLRDPRRFDEADRIAAFCWINEGTFDLAFRIRDAREQVFETPAQTITTVGRWATVETDLEIRKLKRVHGQGELTWPIQFQGFRASASQPGRQTIHLDEFQIEHRVERRAMIRGEFVFDQPTRIYEPGATVGAALALENCSRSDYLQMSVELSWTRPDGSVLKTQSGSKSLPASGPDFRSRQAIDFSLKIEQPGLYRLTARARARGWLTPALFQTSIAVTPLNTSLSRGRSTFFGVRSGLVREPSADQRLEIAIARDIGVHLLAVETPWRQIEPAAGKFDFTAIDPVISDLTARGVAPLIVLTDPPEWAAAGDARVDAVAAVFCELARKYGAALSMFQPEHDALGSLSLAALPAALQRIQDKLHKVREDATVLSPPVPATVQAAAEIGPYLSSSSLQWCIQAENDTHAALTALESFRSAAGLSWDSKFWWLHRAAPLSGPTHLADAEAVLHQYVQAALAGVRGLIWYDLRDNDNDTGEPDTLRGLVRRDFSPKASLLGYATASGMLTGLTCRGPVTGTPPEFDSALFIGSDRHMAVLLPKPNRVRPAVLSAVQGVPGKLELRDFDRRAHSPLTGLATPLVLALDRPFFVTLPLKTPQPEPQLAFGESWLSVPDTFFCGATADNVVTVTALKDVQRGSVSLSAPSNSAVTLDSGRQSFKAKTKEVREFHFKIPGPADATVAKADASLKVTLDAAAVDIPIEVRPLATVLPKGSGWPGPNASYQLAELAPQAGQKASARVTVFGAYTNQALELVIAVRDDRQVAQETLADGTSLGDDLLVGAAGCNADDHSEARIVLTPEALRICAVYGVGSDDLPGWSCAALSGDEKDRVYHIRVPAQAFGGQKLSASSSMRVSLRYQDDDADGLPPVVLSWGAGLDGSRSSEGFSWLRLGESN